MRALTTASLKFFLKIAGDKLDGEWIVIGGTVLPMLDENFRSTVDIDFVSKNKEEKTLKLMEICEEMDLPVDTINQAGAFFLYRIHEFEKNLILLHKGKKATIYRPNLFLYIQLKIQRLSESDAQDCLGYIDYAKKKNEYDHSEKIKKLIDHRLKNEKDFEKINRLKGILKKLS